MTSRPGFAELDVPYQDNLTTFASLPLQDWPEQQIPGESTPLHLVASDGELIRPTPSQYRLGEANLPVALYRDHFLQAVEDNQKVIVTAETGSGKSSQLGLYLLEAGAPIVYITQPRILAARELMERARHNLGEEHAQIAGYLTGSEADSDCPPDARLIYITEDLLLRLANRGELPPDAVIINDEAHEKGVGTIVLLGIMQELLKENPAMRLVVSSATIDEKKFSDYLGGAPVLNLPGRTHPVEQRETDEYVGRAMRRHMKRPYRKNVLAFEPGIARMRSTWATAQSWLTDHTVHMLYGDQSPREQKAALDSSDQNHIVSTRIGETSITPQNKDVVVDSGLSNLGGFEAGVRTLTTVQSSKAVMRQRMGRVGRTKPGIYEIAQAEDAPPTPAWDERPDFDPSVIQNSSVASYLLELRREGRDLMKLRLLEYPTEENLRHDITILRRLGAIPLAGEDSLGIAATGLAMTNIGLYAPEARMLVEARNYTNDVDGTYSDAVRLQVAAAVAVQQVRGMLDTGPGTNRRYLLSNRIHNSLSDEQASDLLFELDVFTELRSKQREIFASYVGNAEEQFERFLHSRDILPNRFYKAVRIYEELCRREGIDSNVLQKPNKLQRQQIIACQITGAQELFVQRGKRVYSDIRGDRLRMLGKHSNINSALGGLVVGTAFNFRGMNRNGRYERRMVSGGSIVTVEQLLQSVPHRITKQSEGYGVNRKGQLVERRALFFDGELRFANVESELSPTEETRVALLTAMMTGMASDLQKPGEMVPFMPNTPNAAAAIEMWKRAQQLEHKSSVDFRTAERYAKLINKVIRESWDKIPLDVTDPEALDELIPRVYLTSLVRPTKSKYVPEVLMRSPDAISINADGEHHEYAPVTYRHGIAYVSIARNRKFAIRREDFAGLAEHHDVKIRIGNGKYAHIDTVFDHIDGERDAELLRQQRKNERRAEMAAATVKTREREEHRQRRENELRGRVDARTVARLSNPPKSKSHRKMKRYAARANTAE